MLLARVLDQSITQILYQYMCDNNTIQCATSLHFALSFFISL